MKILQLSFTLIAAVTGFCVQGVADESTGGQAADLAPPVPITAAGEPIDVEGFAAPFVGDFDEDGQLDLLVGQYGQGRLRIYRSWLPQRSCWPQTVSPSETTCPKTNRLTTTPCVLPTSMGMVSSICCWATIAASE